MAKRILWFFLVATLALTGCQSDTQKGAAVGTGGTASGAVVGGKDSWLLGGLIEGGGAGGGYLVGATRDRILVHDRAGAQQAVQDAQTRPATVQQARIATTADLNGNGYVTLDEVVAMRNAGLTDQQMLERLRATNGIFELTDVQRQYLRDSGVSDVVLSGMVEINRDIRDELLRQSGV